MTSIGASNIELNYYSQLRHEQQHPYILAPPPPEYRVPDGLDRRHRSHYCTRTAPRILLAYPVTLLRSQRNRSITTCRPRRRTAPHDKLSSADWPSLVCHSVVHISSFCWNPCMYILRSHCCHLLLLSTSSSSPTMYHFGFSSLLVAPFSGFRSSFSGYNF